MDLQPGQKMAWPGHTAIHQAVHCAPIVQNPPCQETGGVGYTDGNHPQHIPPSLETLKLLLNHAQLAQGRESWRNKIQDLLGHTQSTVLKMCSGSAV